MRVLVRFLVLSVRLGVLINFLRGFSVLLSFGVLLACGVMLGFRLSLTLGFLFGLAPRTAPGSALGSAIGSSPYLFTRHFCLIDRRSTGILDGSDSLPWLIILPTFFLICGDTRANTACGHAGGCTSLISSGEFVLACKSPSFRLAACSLASLTSVENESVLGYESGSEPILLPDFSTNPGPNRFFYLNQILKSL